MATKRDSKVGERQSGLAAPAWPPSATGIVERVAELLEATYRSADLGNLADDVLAETIYILLTLNTQESVYRRLFAGLRDRYPTWLSMLDAPVSDLAEILRDGGLHHQRATKIQDLLRAVRVDNYLRGVGPAAGGDLTLEYLRDFSAEAAEAYLLRLPGIGTKSARCIQAYALDQDRFAVDTHIQRIFNRLQLVTDDRPKFDHDAFERIVPAPLRRSLHVNLIHHGRKVCRRQKPDCGSCVLVSFCAEGMARVAKEPASEAKSHQRLAVDLFGGAGGLGYGFRTAGFRICLAVEWHRHAAQTYRLNNPGVPVIETDVTTLSADDIRRLVPGLISPDVVLAGPPCQGYSHAGSRRPEDEKNRLYEYVVRLAEDLGASYIVLENVPGLRRVNGVAFEQRILRRLRRKFNAAVYDLVAADFGVPQNRRRLFFLARLKRLGEAPAPPPATHRRVGAPAHPGDGELQDTPRLDDVLDGPLALPHSTDAEYLKLPDGTVLLNASTMRHSQKVVDKIKGIKPGEGPISYRRLERDVARTLVAGHRALPVHPWLDRTISVREAARIQGFDDSYFFCGPRHEQPLQVANAVPPPVAAALASQLSDYLDADRAAATPGSAGPRKR